MSQSTTKRPSLAPLESRPPAATAEPLEGRLLLAGVIQGSVWDDLDADGVRETGESALAAWQVQVLSGGAVLGTAITDAAGTYRFSGLAGGSYDLRLVCPAEWRQVSPPLSYVRTITQSGNLFYPNALTVDFASALPPAADATLSLTASGDLDGADEYLRVEAEGTDLGNVLIDGGLLYAPSTATITIPQATLAALAGDGTVRITVRPSSEVSDLAGAESLTANLSYAATGRQRVTLSGTADAVGVDFAAFRNASLAGRTVNDADRDGTVDSGEAALAGWQVELLDAATQAVIDQTATAADGSYSFSGLGPGPFLVRLAARAGWKQSFPSAADSPRQFSLASGQAQAGVHFAAYELATVSDQVWEDLDGDGIREAGEAGLDGCTVELWDLARNLSVARATTAWADLNGDGTTDPITEAGRFRFADIEPGNYELRLLSRANYTATAPAAGVRSVSLQGGTYASPANFAFCPARASVSGSAWADTDGDGVRDADERAYDGLRVELLDGAGSVVAFTTTRSHDLDGDGEIDPDTERGLYRFDSLLRGRYDLRIDLPRNWSQTSPTVGYRQTFTQADTLFYPNILTFTFPNTRAPASDASLTVTASGDIDGTKEYLRLAIEGQSLGNLFVDNGLPYHDVTAVTTIDRQTLAGLVYDGTVVVTVQPSYEVSDLTGSESITVELAYVSAGTRTITLAPGETVDDVLFAMAPPEVNQPPTLTAMSPLTGAAEDAAFTITYAMLAAAGDEADADGDEIQFRIESLQAGTLLKDGVSVLPGLTLLGPGESVVWQGPPNVSGRVAAFAVRAFDLLDASVMPVPVLIDVTGANDGPTLTRVLTFRDGAPGAPYELTYEALAAAADEADADGDLLRFRIESLGTGTLTLDGAVIDPGAAGGNNLLGPGGKLRWTPPQGGVGLQTICQIVAWDGQAVSAPPVPVRVDPGGENHAPTLTSIQTLAGAVEDSDFAIPFAALASAGNQVDDDGQELSFRIQSVLSGSLSLDGQAVSAGTIFSPGQTLTWRGASDANGVLGAFSVRAWDGLSASVSDVTVRVDVGAVNDAPVLTGPAWAASSEDTPVTFAAAAGWALRVADVDAGSAALRMTLRGGHGTITLGGLAGLSFSQGDGTDDGTVVFTGTAAAINSALEGLAWRPDAGFAGSGGLEVTVDDQGNAGSGGALARTHTVSITVAGINDAPTFAAGGAVEVPQDAGPQVLAGWAGSISPGGLEEAGQVLRFEVSNDNAAIFAVQPAISADGTLTFTPAPGRFGTARVQATLIDNGGTANGGADRSAPALFTITIYQINQAPTFVRGADQIVAEDAGPQVVTQWASSISPGSAGETGQSLAFIVTCDNPSLFSAGPALSVDGRLTYTPAADAHGSAAVTVVLADDGGTAHGGVDRSAPATFTITVQSVNDAPTFTGGTDVTVAEGSGPAALAAWAKAMSAGAANEAAQTLAFELSSDNPALFAAQPALAADGTLTFTPAAGRSGAARVQATLKDSGGTANGGLDRSQVRTFTITVLPVNHAPSFVKGASQSVSEDAGLQSVAQWATSISAGDAGQTLTFVVTTDNPALFAAGPAVGADGTLTYTPAADAFGSAGVTVTLRDNGGTANGGADTSAPAAFTITVLAVNDAPRFAPGPDQAVDEDAGPQVVPGWAGAISAGAANESSQSLAFEVINDNPALFAAAPAVDSGGTLRYTPAAGRSGQAQVRVVLRDGGGTGNNGADSSTTREFTVLVQPVDDAPVARDDSASVREETALFAPSVLSNDSDEEGAPLLALLAQPPEHGTLLFNEDGSFNYWPDEDFFGFDSFTYIAMDSEQGSAEATVTIQVLGVNDEPFFTKGGDQVVLEDAERQVVAGWATSISAGPNEQGQRVWFEVTSDNPGLFAEAPSISADGTLTYRPAPDASGSANVTVVLRDDGGTVAGGDNASRGAVFEIAVCREVPLDQYGRLQYTDASGDTVIAQLVGGGTGSLYFAGAGRVDARHVLLRNTKDYSMFVLTTVGGSTTLRGLQSAGPLAAVVAQTTTFSGAMTIGAASTTYATTALLLGSLKDADVDSKVPVSVLSTSAWTDSDAANDRLRTPHVGTVVSLGEWGADLELTGRNVYNQSLSVFYALGRVGDVTMTMPGSAGVIYAAQWDQGLLRASSLSTLVTIGKYGDAAIRGHFGADIELTAPQAGLGVLQVTGRITGSRISLGGDVSVIYCGQWDGGSLRARSASVIYALGNPYDKGVTGDLTADIVFTGRNAYGTSLGVCYAVGKVQNARVEAPGSIGTFIAGGIRDSFVCAGLREGLTSLPAAAGDFTSAASITLFMVMGVAGNTAASVFENTVVAAASIGTAIVRNVVTASGSEPFGLVSDKPITSFIRYSGAQVSVKVNLDKSLEAEGNYQVRIV